MRKSRRRIHGAELKPNPRNDVWLSLENPSETASLNQRARFKRALW